MIDLNYREYNISFLFLGLIRLFRIGRLVCSDFLLLYLSLRLVFVDLNYVFIHQDMS
jgi:hypothetical protein